MRAIVSSVLAVLLTVIPLKLVLGQAQQQAAITPELSVVVLPLLSDSLAVLQPVSVVRLVPWVESVRWTPPTLTTVSLHLSAVQDATGWHSVPAPKAMSTGVKVIIVVLVVAVVAVAAFSLAVCDGFLRNCGVGSLSANMSETPYLQ